MKSPLGMTAWKRFPQPVWLRTLDRGQSSARSTSTARPQRRANLYGGGVTAPEDRRASLCASPALVQQAMPLSLLFTNGLWVQPNLAVRKNWERELLFRDNDRPNLVLFHCA